ncbi:MAG: tyrosine-type recombinase/integrase [Clostridium sp.]|uniref:tyrosine-type recombinase/integrase n=1 Tax=Clostridium sp. TaxID=1506 RepID=UPI003F367325
MEYSITFRQKDKGWQYIIQYKLNNTWKQKSKQGFKSKREARFASDIALETLKEDFRNDLTLTKEYSSITFKEFLDIYLIQQVHYQTAHSLSNMKYAAKSFSNLYDKKLKDIKTFHIQKAIDMMLEKGFKYSTIKTKTDYLRVLFNTAINSYQIILINPMAKIKLIRDKNPVTRRSLNNQEEIDLLKALEGSRYYLVALVALKAGLRIGEILGLKYSDIDFIKNTLSISRQFKLLHDGTWGLGTPKSSNSYRTIPIPNQLVRCLEEYRKRNESTYEDLIFNFGNKKSFQTVMNKKIKTVGFDVCLHELRHTYATKLIKSGLDLKTVAYLMGHDLKMTIEVYSHVTSDMINKAKNIIETAL